MALHQNGFVYALSAAEIQYSLDMTGKRYRAAVNELMEKGYLVQTETKNVYIFYENPNAPADENATAKKENTTVKVSVVIEKDSK